MIRIVPARKKDFAELQGLFYDSVHTLCGGEYTPAELAAWAPETKDGTDVAATFAGSTVYLAVCDGVTAGFGTLKGGELDLLYIRPGYEHRGIGRRLVKRLEERCAESGYRAVTVKASLTALPFFQKEGYLVMAEETVERRGLSLRRYAMRRTLPPPAPWSVYILRCRDGSLYTGCAPDVQDRLCRHNAGKGAKYTASRRPTLLVYEKQCLSKRAAMREEARIKQLSRSEKLKLCKKGGA